jgi:sugar lactone lactonase YvrE
MRTLVVLIAGVAVLVAAHDVGAQQDISGQWRLGARSDEGLPPFGMNSVVALVHEGQSLTGTFRIGPATNSMMGSLVGANIRLQWNAGDPGDQTVVVFTGTVAERLMTGSVEVGSYTSGTWAAERVPGAGGDAVAHPVGTDLPNPNPTVIMAWGQLPEGRAWGTSAGVDIGPDGHIWTYDRCGQTAFADVCSTSTVDPILKLDRMTGEVLASWGAGMFAFPHGIHVDSDGNVWITDSMGNEAGTVGHQVIKFSPEGEILMTLGRAGVAGSGADTFNEPTDVITAPNGDIFVADGHSGHLLPPPRDATARIMKFTRDGKFVREWGGIGSAPGEFRTPHALAFDSQGRLIVADRGNNRLQIFDQDGNFIDSYEQFSRVSDLFIDADDTLYAIDSESNAIFNPGWLNGIRIGNAAEDRVTAFIPPHWTGSGSSRQGVAGEGVAVDADGNVYVAEGPISRPVAGSGLTKYVRR